MVEFSKTWMWSWLRYGWHIYGLTTWRGQPIQVFSPPVHPIYHGNWFEAACITSFFDVFVMKSEGGKLSHTVPSKPTHTNQYLHHPPLKHSVLNTLIHNARRVYSNIYKKRDIMYATKEGFEPKCSNLVPENPFPKANTKCLAFLPYIRCYWYNFKEEWGPYNKIGTPYLQSNNDLTSQDSWNETPCEW